MRSITVLIHYFLFMGIWFVLMNITSTVWQLYELIMHGKIIIRPQDAFAGVIMACIGAIRLKCLLDDWVHDESERK